MYTLVDHHAAFWHLEEDTCVCYTKKDRPVLTLGHLCANYS
jgi:hypothetical protein